MESTWTRKHPRLVALAMLVAGAAIVLLITSLGWMDAGGRGGGKAIFLVGIGGIAAGVGATQLLWPPRPGQGDGRGAFARAPWPQKLLWIAGGIVGVVAAAVAQTVASGKI